MINEWLFYCIYSLLVYEFYFVNFYLAFQNRNNLRINVVSIVIDCILQVVSMALLCKPCTSYDRQAVCLSVRLSVCPTHDGTE